MNATISECDYTLTGVVANFPNRRACHPRLFFIELLADPSEAGDATVSASFVDGEKMKKDENTSIGENSRIKHEKNQPQQVACDNGSGTPVEPTLLQVLFKHGQGGSYQNPTELEDLRRNIRQGDTLQVHVGGKEWLTKSGTMLLHATQATVTSVVIHGNTGSSYECSCNLALNTDQTASTVSSNQTVVDLPGSGNFTIEESFGITEEEGESHVPSKKERFAVFCDFLISTFSPIKKSENDTKRKVDANDHIVDDIYTSHNRPSFGRESHNLHVYDIAGGRGELALLLTLRGCQVTLIDPRENSGRLSSRSRKQLRKSGKTAFAVERSFFDVANAAAMLNINRSIALSGQRQIVLVGLHPDEVTEIIVDAAVTYRLPFAVVPCCVYSRLFPHRRHPDGHSVRTHERLCQYLQAKAPRIRREQLSFGGQATVLYHLGDYDN